VRDGQPRTVDAMTTERHAWAMLSDPRTGAAGANGADGVDGAAARRTAQPVCGCGQDLDVCTGAHCPRCGTSLFAHAA
jgi:hypothetical protein